MARKKVDRFLINVWSSLDRFLIDFWSIFWSIFDRFLIDFSSRMIDTIEMFVQKQTSEPGRQKWPNESDAFWQELRFASCEPRCKWWQERKGRTEKQRNGKACALALPTIFVQSIPSGSMKEASYTGVNKGSCFSASIEPCIGDAVMDGQTKTS